MKILITFLALVIAAVTAQYGARPTYIGQNKKVHPHGTGQLGFKTGGHAGGIPGHAVGIKQPHVVAIKQPPVVAIKQPHVAVGKGYGASSGFGGVGSGVHGLGAPHGSSQFKGGAGLGIGAGSFGSGLGPHRGIGISKGTGVGIHKGGGSLKNTGFGVQHGVPHGVPHGSSLKGSAIGVPHSGVGGFQGPGFGVPRGSNLKGSVGIKSPVRRGGY